VFHARVVPRASKQFVFAPDFTDRSTALGVSCDAEVADRLRGYTLSLVVASVAIAAVLAVSTGLKVDVLSTAPFLQLIAAGILASVVGGARPALTRIGDCLAPVAIVMLSGIICGFVSLMGLSLHFPLVDDRLLVADRALGLNDPAFVAWLSRAPQFVHGLMGFAYKNTVPILFGSLVIQAWRRERLEIWRSAYCFSGSLITVCTLSILTPAKGLGSWLSDAVLAHLPGGAARYFWPVFDRYYGGTVTQISVDSIGAVVSFPSFHAVMGLIVLMIWRRQRVMFATALAWLGLMLPAAVAFGGHYVVDLIGGFGIWAAWFALSDKVARRVTPLPGNEAENHG